MEALRLILLFLHLVGFAVLLGGAVAQYISGTIRINGSGGVDPALPLGGYKASGWGRENGRAGIEAYTELKAVSVALD